MKRETAINSILDNLNSNIGYKKEELAQVILHDLEELGMLPKGAAYPTDQDDKYEIVYKWEEDV